jgi:hypothetical protein
MTSGRSLMKAMFLLAILAAAMAVQMGCKAEGEVSDEGVKVYVDDKK